MKGNMHISANIENGLIFFNLVKRNPWSHVTLFYTTKRPMLLYTGPYTSKCPEISSLFRLARQLPLILGNLGGVDIPFTSPLQHRENPGQWTFLLPPPIGIERQSLDIPPTSP